MRQPTIFARHGTRWRRCMIGVLATSAGLAPCGVAAQRTASDALPADAMSPPGQLIDLGGYRLHLYCGGSRSSGRPTLVLSAGSGDLAVDWGLVQPALAREARVCSYDR